jgi:hypothetical protein|uniref:Uncharacterized protein n=1 Tax=viral metagenome TaxID=1070528 RepID=A0A6C0BGG9_9ZZZZ
MSCIYTAQGELVCKQITEHFVRSGTRELLASPNIQENFRNVDFRPNEQQMTFLDPSKIITDETIAMAIEKGCTVNIDKDKGTISCQK